jgi:NADH-quinone oxidoreductase subunit F
VAKLKSLDALEKLRVSIVAARDPDKTVISVCSGTGCRAYGCEQVTAAFARELKKQGLADSVDLRATGCHGFCERGPVIVIRPSKIFYQRVKVEDVTEIISETIANGKVVDRLLYTDPASGQKIVREDEVPFYKGQNRIVFGNNGLIDPTSIEDYIAVGGYAALAKVLGGMSPEQVIDDVKKAGLRGRGGGGFLTGDKWESSRKAPGDLKYLICNSDEGDPGAYMDRSVMEGNPHSVLEGMIIGAYAVGAHEGYIYVRNEYPLAVTNAGIAIKQAEALGLLGKNILGSGFNFTIKVNRGGGAFICGESTALMASLEGKVGEPRAKYVHTSEVGLWEKPTVLNNVETWANVPHIINKGVKWYNSIGTKGSKGTKIFSLVGKINNTGLVEVPMGMTLRQIIYEIGGGIPGGKKFKAVQTGGPSGGCIPEKLLDLPVDYDELDKAGSMMGSGGLIVMDEKTCMVDIARYFINFLEGESCGKCVPCREGLKRMGQIFDRITTGEGKEEDMDVLEDLAAMLVDGALCALGTTAANPVLSTIKYFRDEYEAHIKDKRCPAGVCKALITYSIDEKKCPNCGLCIKACPQGAITPQGKKKPVKLDEELCIRCGACYDVCRLDAVKVS